MQRFLFSSLIVSCLLLAPLQAEDRISLRRGDPQADAADQEPGQKPLLAEMRQAVRAAMIREFADGLNPQTLAEIDAKAAGMSDERGGATF